MPVASATCAVLENPPTFITSRTGAGCDGRGDGPERHGAHERRKLDLTVALAALGLFNHLERSKGLEVARSRTDREGRRSPVLHSENGGRRAWKGHRRA
jgi:hypothetical protein